MGIVSALKHELRRGSEPPFPLRYGLRTLVHGTLTDSVPPRLYWRLAGLFRERYAVDVAPYDRPLRPYKTVDLSPKLVTRLTGRAYPPWESRFDLFGSVRDGDWDRRPLDADPKRHPSVQVYGGRRIRETTLYRSLAAHFQRGRPWERTALVETVEDALSDGHRVWHDCGSRAAALKRCEALDVLYNAIRRDGFRSQLRLASDGEFEPSGRPFPSVMRNEVGIDIGRDGTPLLVEGKHRFVIADLLGIETIPAVVYVRHTDWMKRRDAAAVQSENARSGR